jgi:hypothetical protein
LITLDTVPTLTPDAAATSVMVARREARMTLLDK